MKNNYFNFKNYIRDLLTESAYTQGNVRRLGDNHPTVQFLEQQRIKDKVTTALNNVTEPSGGRTYYEVTDPSLKGLLLKYHGAGATGAGESGEWVVSAIGGLVSSQFSRINGAVRTGNLNSGYPGLGIKAGFFPSSDVAIFKGNYSQAIRNGTDLNFTNVLELTSAKRVGSPKTVESGPRLGLRHIKVSDRNFGDNNLINVARVLLLEYLKTEGGTGIALPPFADDPSRIDNNSSIGDLLAAAAGIESVTFAVSDIEICTIPYFDQREFDRNQDMTEAELAEFPTIEALLLNTGGTVTVNLVNNTITRDPSDLNKIHGSSHTKHTLVGILVSGDMHELIQVSQQNFQGASQDDTSNMPPQAQFEAFVGQYASAIDDLRTQIEINQQYTFFRLLSESGALSEEKLKNASSEFKAAMSILIFLEKQINIAGQATFDQAQFPERNIDGKKDRQLPLSSEFIDSGDRANVSFKTGRESTLGKAGAQVISKNLQNIVSEDGIPKLGEVLAKYLKKTLVKKLKNARDSEGKILSAVQAEITAKARLDASQGTTSPDSAELQSAKSVISFIDDFLDNTAQLISYLALLSAECLRHNPDLAGRYRDTAIEMEAIAIEYATAVESEVAGIAISNPSAAGYVNPELSGRLPRPLGLDVERDTSGTILNFPGVQYENLSLMERINKALILLERGDVVDFQIYQKIDVVLKGLEAISNILEAIANTANELSVSDDIRQIAENKIRRAVRHAILSELKKRLER